MASESFVRGFDLIGPESKRIKEEYKQRKQREKESNVGLTIKVYSRFKALIKVSVERFDTLIIGTVNGKV